MGLQQQLKLSQFIPLVIGLPLLTYAYFKVKNLSLVANIVAICIFVFGISFGLQRNGIAPASYMILFVPSCVASTIVSFRKGLLFFGIAIVISILLACSPLLPFGFKEPPMEAVYFSVRIAVPVFCSILMLFFLYLTRINWSLIYRLREANKDLEERNEHKKQFLAKMSHEVRTPLNGIYGISQLLQTTEDPAEKEDYLHTLDFSTQTLLHVVNEILDYSKIEKGKIELEVREINLTTILNEIVHLYKPKCEEVGIQINLNLQDSVPQKVMTDSFRLTQIFSNLINNAIKFTREGSITLHASCEGNQLRFAVQDTGIGIPGEKLDEVFKEYGQADKSTSRNYGGTGLGLNITKELVSLFGGNIRVDSEYGKGSTFSFWIPLSLPKEPQVETVQPTKNEDVVNIIDTNILIAEDNLVNQKIIRKFLSRLGYKNYKVVPNGKLAVQEIQEKDNFYHVILMDINMPEMDGIEATKKIRALNAVHQPVIIALTASAFAEEMENCIAAGMDNFVSKPVRLNEFKEIMSKYVS